MGPGRRVIVSPRVRRGESEGTITRLVRDGAEKRGMIALDGAAGSGLLRSGSRPPTTRSTRGRLGDRRGGGTAGHEGTHRIDDVVHGGCGRRPGAPGRDDRHERAARKRERHENGENTISCAVSLTRPPGRSWRNPTTPRRRRAGGPRTREVPERLVWTRKPNPRSRRPSSVAPPKRCGRGRQWCDEPAC